MSQHVAHVPPTATRAEEPRRLLGTRRRKLVAGALAAAALAGATGVVVAMRPSTTPETTPASDVPRRDGNAIVVSPTFREVAGLKTVAALSAPLMPVVHAVGSVEF